MADDKSLDNQIRFSLHDFTPETLPMARLAQYLEKFAALLGNESNIHFRRVSAGSAVCEAFADSVAVPKITERTNRIKEGTASHKAAKANEEINDLMAQDNTSGDCHLGSTKLIEFPGKLRRSKEEIGPVRRSTSIDGEIFSIGGKDDTINVQLRANGVEMRCTVPIELARRLAPHMFGGKVRLIGHGNWYRLDGVWTMKTFSADDFKIPSDKNLAESLDHIRCMFPLAAPDEFMASLQELRGE